MPSELEAALRRALTAGPIIGAAISGVLLYIPTHSLGTALGTALLMLIVIGGLRAADEVLAPLWDVLGRVPAGWRRAAGVVLPMLYALSRFGVDASGQEVSRARSTLVVSSVLAYVLLRPGRGALREPA